MNTGRKDYDQSINGCIPETEPIFIFRSTDQFTLMTLARYRELLGDVADDSDRKALADSVEAQIQRIRMFQQGYPDKVKYPTLKDNSEIPIVDIQIITIDEHLKVVKELNEIKSVMSAIDLVKYYRQNEVNNLYARNEALLRNETKKGERIEELKSVVDENRDYIESLRNDYDLACRNNRELETEIKKMREHIAMLDDKMLNMVEKEGGAV